MTGKTPEPPNESIPESANPSATDPNTADKVKAGVEKASELADKATGTLDGAKNAFSAIKWIGISLVCLTILMVIWGAYKMLYKPVAVVGDAAGSVVEAVGDGAGAIKDGASDVINRLVIQPTSKNRLNTHAETAFAILNDMDETKGNGVRERMFRKTSFPGSDGKICKLTLDFGSGELPVFAATDNEAHATAKSLGSKDDRLIRMVIKAPKDDIEFNTEWDADAKNWIMRWKQTVIKKPINDEIAGARIADILMAVPAQCKP